MMAEADGGVRRMTQAEGGAQQHASSALTIVRIKRRRDDPGEPEIILEAAGAYRNKQPRYDEVLLQFQGLSVLGPAGATLPMAPRRRFRRLRTLDVSVFEAMSESEVLQMIRAPTGSATATSAPGAAAITQQQPPRGRPVAALGPAASSLPFAEPLPVQMSGTLEPLQAPIAAPPQGLQEEAFQPQAAPPPRGSGPPARRTPVKAAHGTSVESRISALRTSHRQAASAARYKQVRRKRDVAEGSEGGEAGNLLNMYDLERLPAAKKPNTRSGARGDEQGSRHGVADLPQSQQAQALPQPETQEQQQQQWQQHPQPQLPQQQLFAPLSAIGPQPLESQQPQPGLQPSPVQQQPEVASLSRSVAPTREEEELLQRCAPLVDEALKSLSVKQPQEVRRIPARPKRAQKAAAVAVATAAAGATPPPHAPAPAPAPESQPGPVTAAPVDAMHEAEAAVAPAAAGGDAAVGATVAAAAASGGQEVVQSDRSAQQVTAAADVGGGGGGGDQRMSEDCDSCVYDVYVPVYDDAEPGEQDSAEESWPWLDALSAVDMAVPVIEVAENDDEFFWAGELEAEAAQRAAAAEEHDSEDSNAESYYANSYPDEEDAPYGNDAGSSDEGDDELVDEAEPADAAVGSGYGWAAALAMRRRDLFSADEDDGNEEADEDDEDEEIFGRRRRRHVRPAKVSSYYRTEDDDYSEHSSFLSEEEERREAEERRRRAIFMH